MADFSCLALTGAAVIFFLAALRRAGRACTAATLALIEVARCSRMLLCYFWLWPGAAVVSCWDGVLQWYWARSALLRALAVRKACESRGGEEGRPVHVYAHGLVPRRVSMTVICTRAVTCACAGIVMRIVWRVYYSGVSVARMRYS